MSDSRWLEELKKTYVAESVGQPTNLQEEILLEQEEYISILENVVATIVEDLGLDIDLVVEAVAKKTGTKSKPLSPAQLKALGMTRTAERVAARGTGGGMQAAAARTGALKKLEAIAGTIQGRNLLKKIK